MLFKSGKQRVALVILFLAVSTSLVLILKPGSIVSSVRLTDSPVNTSPPTSYSQEPVLSAPSQQQKPSEVDLSQKQAITPQKLASKSRLSEMASSLKPGQSFRPVWAQASGKLDGGGRVMAARISDYCNVTRTRLASVANSPPDFSDANSVAQQISARKLLDSCSQILTDEAGFDSLLAARRGTDKDPLMHAYSRAGLGRPAESVSGRLDQVQTMIAGLESGVYEALKFIPMHGYFDGVRYPSGDPRRDIVGSNVELMYAVDLLKCDFGMDCSKESVYFALACAHDKMACGAASVEEQELGELVRHLPSNEAEPVRSSVLTLRDKMRAAINNKEYQRFVGPKANLVNP